MYPFNFPFARFLGSLGVPLSIVIIAHEDKDAGVYTAFSPNVKGLHVEAESLDEVLQAVRDVLPELLEINEGESIEKLTHSSPKLNLRTPLCV